MSDFANAKHRKLVDLLYKKTVDRSIKWELVNSSQLYLRIGGGSLYLYGGINSQGEDMINFRLFDSNGELADSFSDENLVYDNGVPTGFGNWYLLCDALMEIAKRQATGADDVLDAMLAELDDDVPF